MATGRSDEQRGARRLSDGECLALFGRLFPLGLAGEDIRLELAPNGWAQSPLLAAFHPTVDQVWQETMALQKGLRELSESRNKKDAGGNATPVATREEIAASWIENPVDEQRELTSLMGECLWDIFSDNHAVVTGDGRVADLGSFRGSSAFIAKFISGENTDGEKNFYMGSWMIDKRVDLGPVYRLIFTRLRAEDCAWRYSFPRIYLVKFDLPGELKHEFESYSASEGFGAEGKRTENDAEHARQEAELEQLDKAARAEARARQPPETILAYFDIFGQWPRGWPP
jgi:hypothetical protein